jgi:hypothetical protein
VTDRDHHDGEMTTSDQPVFERFHTHDPFGNRLEFLGRRA